MARIPEDFIRSVEGTVDIVDVVSRYVTLKRAGASHKGLCPFHEEKTPSFVVFPASQRYKCFGCGEGGNVFTFLMRRSNMGFRDVLEELAREAGLALPDEAHDPGDGERHQRRGEAMRALDYAARFFKAVLARETGRAARAYLEKRGFESETIEAFGIGFSPDEFEGLRNCARKERVGDEALFDAGLVRRNERGQPYDMFRGRIMFPIHDLRGLVIGFGARALGDAQPKYLNSPDSSLFHKGREMYGLHLARPAALKAGRLVVVEGYTDVMAAHQSGLKEVAAGLGTALTVESARQLRRFGVPVLLLYDGDEAGRRAAERAAGVMLEAEVESSVALLPPGRDPADLLRQEGLDALEAVLVRAEGLWDYRVRRACERHGLDTLDGRGRAAAELLETVSRMADPLRRDMALKLLAERLGVPESTLRDRLPAPGRAPGGGPPPATSSAWAQAERDLIAAALVDGAFCDRLLDHYRPQDFRDPRLAELAGAIHDLRQGGESVTREALMGVLADRDQAVEALQAIEERDDAVQRAGEHLAGIADRRRLRSALEASDLEAVVRARRTTEAMR